MVTKTPPPNINLPNLGGALFQNIFKPSCLNISVKHFKVDVHLDIFRLCVFVSTISIGIRVKIGTTPLNLPTKKVYPDNKGLFLGGLV